MKHHLSQLLAACLLLAGVTVLSLTGGCAGSSELLPEDHLGEVGQHLDEAQCLYFDVNGKDTICHYTGAAVHPYTLIRISDQACINSHSAHSGDYITSLDPTSSLYDPTCNGQGCLPTNAPCDGTLGCCTGSCVSGTCVDPCSPNPCQNGGTCAASGSAYTCTCTGGYTGTNCETPPPPAGPAIGCYDSPGTSGDTGIDDLYYYGPLDTLNNIRFHRQPRDGTCSGDSYLPNGALIEAANAAAAAIKCLSFGRAPYDAALFWPGLAGYWACL